MGEEQISGASEAQDLPPKDVDPEAAEKLAGKNAPKRPLLERLRPRMKTRTRMPMHRQGAMQAARAASAKKVKPKRR